MAPAALRGDTSRFAAMRLSGGVVDPEIRVHHVSAKMLGKVSEIPQTELTPFYPPSP